MPPYRGNRRKGTADRKETNVNVGDKGKGMIDREGTQRLDERE
jgi:hypothetical protein